MDLSYDARVANAMNRVLEAERSARAAVADCESQMQALMEQARQQRRNILERAQKRVLALHARSAQSVARRAERILGPGETASVGQPVDRARLRAAIERLLERLTAAGDEP